MFRRSLSLSLSVLERISFGQVHSKQSNIKCVKFPSNPRFLQTETTISTENLEKVTFEEVKKFGSDKNVLIIDVREPNELVEHGILPGSINIPLGIVQKVLKETEESDFLKKYGKPKPCTGTPIIFSCMRGRRSEEAQIAALQLGYKNVKNYKGGWVEWAEKIKSC